MGALVMAHADDNGLVLPPKLAPIQVVIVPIFRGEDELERIRQKVQTIQIALAAKGITVKFDERDTHKPGFKFAEYELKGIPVRLAVGPRDIENNTVEVARRDTLTKESVAADETLAGYIEGLLEDIQHNMFQKALKFREENTHSVDTYEKFKEILEDKGGFIKAHWDGTAETEAAIKAETKATIRCIPLDAEEEAGVCIYSGKPSNRRVIFAKAY
jgi:prolyl-tRNA synthetase